MENSGTMEQQLHIPWPPSYNIRTSLKAKHIRLTICRAKGLEVILPNRVKNFDILHLLETKKLWILKHLSNLRSILEQDEQINKNKTLALPNSIQFLAIHQTWGIIYQNSPTQKINLKTYPISNKLIISGDLTRQDCVLQILIKWCKIQAKSHLPCLLHPLGAAHKLLFNNIVIKAQKTLWGSCSSNNNINLNYKLIFLPDYLAKHVMLHELAHVKYKNHQSKFWEFLKSLDHLCDQHNKMLKTADQLMPNWVNV